MFFNGTQRHLREKLVPQVQRDRSVNSFRDSPHVFSRPRGRFDIYSAVSMTLSPPDSAVCSESRRYGPVEPGRKITSYSSRVSEGPKEEMAVPEMTFVLSPHLPPPFNPCLLQILRFLRTLTPHAAVPLGFCCPIIRIILQKDGQPSSEPIHVSTRSGLRIPEQFCLQTHSGTFNVLLLGLQRKLKTFFFLPWLFLPH